MNEPNGEPDAPISITASNTRRGVEFADVIDMIGEDGTTGEVVLAMEERRPWDGSPKRLFELQEKFNAYLAFALDGEMIETYPNLAGRPLRLRLETGHPPDLATSEFLEVIRHQIGFQGITLEVFVGD